MKEIGICCMKQSVVDNFYVATVLAAFVVVSCNNDSSSDPSGTAYLQESSGNETLLFSSSSESLQLSSSSEVLAPSSSSLVVEVPSSQAESSSSVVAESSSSRTASSSSLSSSSETLSVTSSSSVEFLEQCIDFAQMCVACDGYDCPIPFRPPDECYEKGAKVEDCVTGGVYTCADRYGTGSWSWTLDEGQCLNVALTQCTAGETNCGRKRCNSNAPMIVTDCKSGDEYACADGFWTLMKKSGCSHITELPRKGLYAECEAEEGTKVVDCIQRKEFVCNRSYWRDLDPVAGEDCIVESEFRVVSRLPSSDSTAKNQSGSAYVDELYLCTNGKWTKYGERLNKIYELNKCRRHPIHRTPCDEKDSDNKKIRTDECEFVCRGGEYIFVPPPIEN